MSAYSFQKRSSVMKEVQESLNILYQQFSTQDGDASIARGTFWNHRTHTSPHATWGMQVIPSDSTIYPQRGKHRWPRLHSEHTRPRETLTQEAHSTLLTQQFLNFPDLTTLFVFLLPEHEYLREEQYPSNRLWEMLKHPFPNKIICHICCTHLMIHFLSKLNHL